VQLGKIREEFLSRIAHHRSTWPYVVVEKARHLGSDLRDSRNVLERILYNKRPSWSPFDR
jgi:hypothetical protein